jgi:hypothetical protein
MSITVVQVIRAMGIEPTPELTWSVGPMVRDLYESRVGHLPMKALRPKTNAGGTHCFAIYPEEMWSDIEKIVRAHQTEAARQRDLFEYDAGMRI